MTEQYPHNSESSGSSPLEIFVAVAKKTGSLIVEGLLMMGNPDEGYDYRHRGDPPDSRRP